MLYEWLTTGVVVSEVAPSPKFHLYFVVVAEPIAYAVKTYSCGISVPLTRRGWNTKSKGNAAGGGRPPELPLPTFTSCVIGVDVPLTLTSRVMVYWPGPVKRCVTVWPLTGSLPSWKSHWNEWLPQEKSYWNDAAANVSSSFWLQSPPSDEQPESGPL